MLDTKQLQDIFSNLNVLYVEDDELLRNMSLEFFNIFFENIDIASDGEEGLERFQEKEYALVISDLNMPKINGYEMFKQIRKRNKNTVLIMMSGEEDGIEGGSDIYDAFLSKPVRFADIIQAFDSVKERLTQA